MCVCVGWGVVLLWAQVPAAGGGPTPPTPHTTACSTTPLVQDLDEVFDVGSFRGALEAKLRAQEAELQQVRARQ